ncbi:MAG: sodium/proline symporter PutP [Clostridiales bacterium]|nr:sodium/proline symporter PutP [Clostridiales bacterium]MDD6935489.1 sodium/proline symporter PutP [Clostridiales bacterium]MDY2961340.1 sodium/proline symporter PutP [Oscillospiraceae bacterium]
MNTVELMAMLLYFALVIGVGVYFFFKDRKQEGEKEYFLGGRNMGGWVAALSAGASDMSAWVLMGLPGSIYLYGVGKVWIAVGLLIGTVCAWLFVAPRLRRYSIRANDSITIPQFLTNRFLSKNRGLQIISALVFVVVYCVYSASSISACGTLFNTVIGMDKQTAMIIATAIILLYVFLGGFNAVCWTDFFQGLLMLGALMLAPIIALFAMNAADFIAPAVNVTENYYSLLSGGSFDKQSLMDILSGLGWGLGYFGMPHILVRYISIKSEHEMRKSQIIGSGWTTLILIMSCVVGIVGRKFLGDGLEDQSLVFVTMVRKVFPAFIAGILLSAILAAAMSTADSQLLASSSAFASDIYKPVMRKNASDHEMLWAGRIIVVVISVVAFFIANSPNCGGIMALVECAWAGFGSAFGPVILLALYWRRLTYSGAVAGVTVGFVVDALWYAFLSTPTGLYEIIPGFLCGLIAAVVVSLLSKAPGKEVTDLFDRAFEPTD